MRIIVSELRNKPYINILGEKIKAANKCEVEASVYFDNGTHFSGEFTFKEGANVKGFASAERAIRQLFNGEESE
jgi:hypothetical protein